MEEITLSLSFLSQTFSHFSHSSSSRYRSIRLIHLFSFISFFDSFSLELSTETFEVSNRVENCFPKEEMLRKMSYGHRSLAQGGFGQIITSWQNKRSNLLFWQLCDKCLADLSWRMNIPQIQHRLTSIWKIQYYNYFLLYGITWINKETSQETSEWPTRPHLTLLCVLSLAL